MAEFKLGRIRFVWKGEWNTGTVYYKDDIIRNGGKTYVCTIGHTSASNFYTDLSVSPSRWNEFTDGTEWRDDWSTDTFYNVNDIVKYGGILYICQTSHTSAATDILGLEQDIANWDIFIEGLDWKDDWTVSTRYKKNDLVKYGGYTYVCNEHHVSAATTTLGLEQDQSKWDEFNQGIEYKGNWSGSSVRYKINDVVKYGASLWITTTAHTSTVNFADDASNWSQFVEGLEFENDWNVSSNYQPGDIVRYGGNQYVSKTNHTGANPSSSTANWDLFAEGFRFQAEWSAVTNYKIGEVVSLRGYTYLAIADNLDSEPPSANWNRLNSGISWQGEWVDDVEYKLGDAVRFGPNTYICVLGHRSEEDDGSSLGGDPASRPDQDTTGTYWNLLAIGSETASLTTRGDLVYFGGAGPTRLPIGREGQVLVAGAQDPEWSTLGDIEHAYFVAENGTDLPAPIWGKTWDKPWKTIRYACEQVENGARNPNAQFLLEMNRIFIQREVTAWIRAQIQGNIAPFTSAFVYDDYKCERDVGFIIDRLIHDIGRGGNLKIRAATQTFLNALDDGPFSKPEENNGTGPYNNLAVEAPVSSAAYKQMLSLIEDVLDNQAPSVIYQNVTDDSSSIAQQYVDLDLETELSALTEVRSLVGIVTGAFDTYVNTSGSDTVKRSAAVATIPERFVPFTLINVATGRYRETLPIIVPAYSCVKGDELRSTNAGPAASLIDISDSFYTIETFNHLSGFIGDIVTGTTVTPTAGNTATQSQDWPVSESGIEDALVTSLVNVMKHQSDYRLGTMHTASLTDPVGYNVSYLTGYGNARKLIKENKKWLQEEVVAFLEANYPNSIFTGSITNTTLTVTEIEAGNIINPGMLIRGTGILDGTFITTQLTGSTGGVGTYTVGKSQTVLSTTIRGVIEYGRTKTRRDTGYIIDALIYDLTYGGNALAIQAGLAYYDGDDDTQPQIPFHIKAATLGSLAHLKARLISAANAVVVSSPSQNTILQFTGSSAGSAGTIALITDALDDIIEIIDQGPQVVGSTVTLTDPVPADGVNSTTALINDYNSLENGDDFDAIKDSVETYLSTNYSDVDYSVAKARRDTGIVLKAVGFDFMFNSTYQTVKAAWAYLRLTSSELFDTDDRIKEATRNSLQHAKDQAVAALGAGTAADRLTASFQIVDDVIFGGSNEGDMCQTTLREKDWSVLQLEKNRAFILAEIEAYVETSYSDTATATDDATEAITISDTGWLRRNSAIKFTGTVFGDIVANQTYFVQNVIDSTTFTVATQRYATTPINLTSDSGSMSVELVYNQALCLRDVNTYVDALKWDLKYTSNYKSRFVARYYANAVTGSQEEDMYYLRDGTGIRDQTLDGLSGDLTPPNEYGTSRVTAGAYCSLDPGWGSADFRTWILSRSPYVQGVTTFGTAAIGQKIDGALHNGGNDSIVSNDFTQVISDGIGAWVANNGRAELVSVFSYYSHIGYLSTEGGRIRGTNGNNSYGEFGSVAEGVDGTEIPNTAAIDNKTRFDATVSNVVTNGSALLRFEFENAGNDYRKVQYVITGGGVGSDVVGDEFRDDGVHQVRLLELAATGNDGEFGGSGYLTNSNTAQAGGLNDITISATDGELSTAYIGMKIVITGGTGAGQFGIIGSYDAGSKIAGIANESTENNGSYTIGWDTMIPGTTIVAPDSSSTYTIEPTIRFAEPVFVDQTVSNLPSGSYADMVYGETAAAYTSLSGTYSGSGASGATFSVIREGWKYTVILQSAGTGYTRLATITIAGTSLGGLTPTNDLVLTITSVNSITGAIQEFDQQGYGVGGRFVAVKGTSTDEGAYSNDGLAWTAMTLPSSGNWSAVAQGIVEDGSTVAPVSRFVAVRSGSNQAAYSEDGINWTASTMPHSDAWTSVVFGEGRFVAIASDNTTVAVSQDGELWDLTGELPSTGYRDVTYGKGIFVAVKYNSSEAATSADGTDSWAARDLGGPPQDYVSVAYGNNVFVALAENDLDGRISVDGVTWSSIATEPLDGSSGNTGYQKIRYGQGLFMATAYRNGVTGYSFVATSENGIHWKVRGITDGGGSMEGYRAIAFGNPQRTGHWAVLQYEAGTHGVRIRGGARARGRAAVSDAKIFRISVTEPGSGYDSAPVMTVIDPNNTFEVPVSVRLGKGTLANPTFVNRGSQFVTGSATVDSDFSDGFADNYQPGSFVAVRRITQRPVPGSNIEFSHLPGRTFKLVNVLTFLGSNDGSYRAFYQISPQFTISEAPDDLTTLQTRIRYSQVRLTGHDFLDIGTGNFEQSNYPGTALQSAIPASETVENNGGRVFFTATDQDGNFRVGNLFAIEQSTGVATLNADAFNISGLQELNLGNVTLGGGSATVTEFSTDPFFTQDSDNVVPTQRAIKAYIAAQIGGGGATLNVNKITAGNIEISTNQITNVTGGSIKMAATFEFRGGVTGMPIAFNYFLA